MYAVQIVSTLLDAVKAASLNLLPLWEHWAERTFQGRGRGVECPITQVQLRSHILSMTSFNTEYLHNMAASFPRASDPKGQKL